MFNWNWLTRLWIFRETAFCCSLFYYDSHEYEVLALHIITNNPKVADAYCDIACFQGGSVSDVFTAVRDAIHKGARLISHPLSGSVKPNESPYKSVIVSTNRGDLDFQHLRMIEDAIATLKKLQVKHRVIDNATQQDFQIIDLDLINCAMIPFHV